MLFFLFLSPIYNFKLAFEKLREDFNDYTDYLEKACVEYKCTGKLTQQTMNKLSEKEIKLHASFPGFIFPRNSLKPNFATAEYNELGLFLKKIQKPRMIVENVHEITKDVDTTIKNRLYKIVSIKESTWKKKDKYEIEQLLSNMLLLRYYGLRFNTLELRPFNHNSNAEHENFFIHLLSELSDIYIEKCEDKEAKLIMEENTHTKQKIKYDETFWKKYKHAILVIISTILLFIGVIFILFKIFRR